ncbi:uncharacterized protein BX664DRAFT_337083, partial [Halteromyces radiatus]|uniref:uncharacterized protein n=1 Tax=Halteromyces radiatus TaxID=101107 RepID=UPI00221FB2F4
MTLTEEDNSSIYFSCDEEEEGVSNSEYSDDGNTFKIVLVNIKETFDQLHVHCEEFEFLESGPEVEYITLSYRWGELNEQRVAATEDYNAHITSFLLKDFYRLCLRMMTEPDLENINYVWVDAICVDQANEQHKKATIYRMSDIYEHATYIVAVPDLHKESLLDTSKTHRVMSKKIIKYRWYLYHFISENYQELDQLLNTLEIPSDYNLQRFIGKDPSIWDVGDSEDEEEEEEEIKWEASLTEKKLQNKDMQNCLAKYQRHIRKRFMEKKIKGILASLYHIRDMFLDWANRAWVIS